ncbi:MAG: winged helix DNA-binding domain-containing protein, partial [Candidatus Eisenbacteria bacterium]|nr:winged helix DNA-binding domain-containing protein [Candidatus Eisenbacteria bacterium]
VLAPLDNLLWDRGMVQAIFGFTYTWEVYLPAARRKYGYYVLPVLYDDRLVARFEPESCRDGDPLRIRRWWWEEGIGVTRRMRSAAERALKRLAASLGADGVSAAALRRMERA